MNLLPRGMKMNLGAFTAAALLLFSLAFVPAVSNAHDETVAAANSRNMSPTGASSIPERLREKYDDRVENLKNNQEIRKNMLEEQRDRTGSTSATSSFKGRDLEKGPGQGRGAASTTKSAGPMKARVRTDIFEKQKNHLVMQLNRALANLNQIRGRISSRIEKAEQSGRDMKKAKELLSTADKRLAEAKTAIDALILLSPQAPGSTNTASTSIASTSATTSPDQTIDLGRPRQAGADAIRAVETAKRALVDVVVEIAHNMGLKLGQTATMTAATPTPPVTSTTTSTTTGTTTP